MPLQFSVKSLIFVIAIVVGVVVVIIIEIVIVVFVVVSVIIVISIYPLCVSAQLCFEWFDNYSFEPGIRWQGNLFIFDVNIDSHGQVELVDSVWWNLSDIDPNLILICISDVI